MNNNNTNKIAALLTPLLLFIMCGAITFLIMIVPFQKFKVYLNLAFMDNLGTKPDSSSGLVITEGEIDTNYNGTVYESGRIDIPSFGQQYAVLKCEKKGFTAPVYWGSTDELLERGACQSSDSVVLGEKGNVVIDAHVDTFFEKLSELENGDEIVLYTNYGRFTYIVDKEISFMKSDKTYILPKNEDVLTLYTCKRQILGSSDARTGFTCNLKQKEFYYEN